MERTGPCSLSAQTMDRPLVVVLALYCCLQIIQNACRLISTRRRRLLRIIARHRHQTPSRRYAVVNTSVPLLNMYFDGEADLKTDFRLSRGAINRLVSVLPTGKRHGWESHLEILFFVYWLAHGASYRAVSHAFAVPKTSIFRAVHKVAEAIVAMRNHCIRFPKLHELDAVGAGFAALARNEAFRKCVGAIDGCHIRIKAPAGPASSDYLNGNLFHSIQLQAICDSQCKFLDTFTGYPGSVHDTRVLKNSPVFTNHLYPPMDYFIVGDGGYPCIQQPVTILTPYREPLQGRVQERYNTHHAKARGIIERAFGMMKTRWPSIFFKALEVDPAFVPAIITCCAALHNICLGVGDIEEPVQEAWRDNVDQAPLAVEENGAALRNKLAALISEPIDQPLDHDYS